MDKHKKNTTPTTKHLRSYVAGELSTSEQHQVEKSALKNQQIDDILEGLQAIKMANVDEKAVLTELRQKVRHRVDKKEKKWLPYYYASAAAVVLALGLGWWVVQQEDLPLENTSTNIAVEQSPPAPKTEDLPIQLQQPSSPKVTVKKSSVTAPIISSRQKTNLPQNVDSPTLALEEPKTELSTTVPESIPTQNTEQEVVVSTKMAHQNRIAAAASSKSDVQSFKKESLFTLRGKVLDAQQQQAVVGATITKEGNPQGIITDSDGKFTFPNIRPNEQLNIASIGFQTTKIIVKDSLITPILLQEDNQSLNEVVTIGYGKKITNSKASPKSGWVAYRMYLKTAAQTFITQHPEAPRGRVVLDFKKDSTGQFVDFENKNQADTLLFKEAVRIVKSAETWNVPLKEKDTKKGKVRMVIRF